MVTMTRNIPSSMLKSAQLKALCRGIMPDLPDWVQSSWTVEEASEKTGYNQEYLRRLIRKGEIEAAKIAGVFLIKVDSLKAYIAGVEGTEDGRYGPKSK